MVKKDKRRIIRCPGRFQEAREKFIWEAIRIIRDDREKFRIDSEENLRDLIDLIGDDLFYPVADPYFKSETDTLRWDPSQTPEEDLHLTLVPLLGRDTPMASMASEVKDAYARRVLKAPEDLVEKLRPFHIGCADLGEGLGLDLSQIMFPCKDRKNYTSIRGYRIAGDFGIGGIEGESVIIADAPYMIYLIKKGGIRFITEDRVSLGIGFWYNLSRVSEGETPDKEMLVAQIQNAHGGEIPNECHMGVLALGIAERIARKMGFDRIITYSSKIHPMFVQYPMRTQRRDLAGQFHQLYDKSAKTLVFEGNSSIGYTLCLRDNSNSRKGK